MSARRHVLEVDEPAIVAATRALDWDLRNVLDGPRRLVFGGADWEVTFTVGAHVELRAYDADTLAEALASHLPLGEALPAAPLPASSAPASVPQRPRLADTVEVRAFASDGEARVLLLDLRTDAALEIAPEVWDALRHADGTRDLDGLRLAAGRSVDLTPLAEAGLLADGLPAPTSAPPVAPARPRVDRPIETLPGFTLRCDGAGGCCRAYGSVPFTSEEATRAERSGLSTVAPLFTPLRRGSGALAVMQVDGACAFLDPEDRCALHRAGGPETKPFACRLYPTTFVDDGRALRVSAAPECACVFESAGANDETPLWSGGPPPPRAVRVLADPVAVSERRCVGREEYRVWADALHAHLGETPDDLAAVGLSLAHACDAMGLAPPAGVDVGPPRLPDLSALPRALTVAADRPARSPRSRAVARWVIDAVPRLEDWIPPTRPEDERLYMRALVFGHRLTTEGRPIAAGLRERAARLVLARAMDATPAPSARLAKHPLGALEAALRHLDVRAVAR